MSKRIYKEGWNRKQNALLPPSVDDYVDEQNPVRVIEAYIDALNPVELGFERADGGLTAGQPAYDPRSLLKLYLYGYLNRIRSSRRLAHECRRNLELMWLLDGLTPGYRAIAEFRARNSKALRAVNKDFVLLCKELELFGRELVAIDGSFFRGNASKSSIKTAKQPDKELKSVKRTIENYQETLDRHDAEDEGGELGQDEKFASGRRRSTLSGRPNTPQNRQVHHQERYAAYPLWMPCELLQTVPLARHLLTRGRQSPSNLSLRAP